MNKVAIRVENLSKLYHIGQGKTARYETLSERIGDIVMSPLRSIGSVLRGQSSAVATDSIWALKDVSFEVGHGEVVGIIGRNGAGKSTLLKILSQITEPTTGTIDIYGRIGALLEVGTGFHPELTGRENVFLNGAILGMTRNDIHRKFDEIVEFSGVEKFIDTPVKHYSSGMQVRLAFAVAAHLEPEILVVDEVLAVGDAEFQKKCLGKMGDVTKEGRTVLFVSHNMRAVAELCQRCMCLYQGQVIFEGRTQEVISDYLSSSAKTRNEGEITDDMHIHPSGDVYFRHVSLLDLSNKKVKNLFFRDLIRMSIDMEVCLPVKAMRIMLAIEKLDGSIVSVFHHTDDEGMQLFNLQPGVYEICLETMLNLVPGRYTVHLAAKPDPGYWGLGRSWDWVQSAFDFFIEEVSEQGQGILSNHGVVRPAVAWSICQK